MNRKGYGLCRKVLFAFFAVLLFLGNAFAQRIEVTGTVTSSSGEAVPGATVVLVGTQNGTITDFDGKFVIKAPGNGKLMVSFIGFEPTEVPINGRPTLSIVLKENVIGLEEVVAVGYGTQKKKEVTGAVVQVKSDEITKVATSDIAASLQGKVAGVNVQSSSGAPGAVANIQIRGVATSFEGANNNPLYVVDGIPYDGDPGLSPNEIESIDILKDAASTAAYGTRGAAGVILITTKKGEVGQMKVSYNGFYGVQKITSGLDLVNYEDFMYIETLNKVYNQANAYENDFWYTTENSPHLMSNNNSIMDIVQIDNAPTQSHTVQLSGGNKNLMASTVLSYFSQDGTLINSKYKRMNGRTNVVYSKDKLKISTGFGFSVDDKKNAPYGILYDAYKFNPYSDLIDPNKLTFTSEGSDNDLTNASNLAIKFAQTDVTEGKGFNVNSNLTYELLKGLNLTYTVGANYNNTFQNKIIPLFSLYDAQGNLKPQSSRSSISNASGYASKVTSEAGFNYARKFGKHQFKVLGVYTYEKSTYKQHAGVRYDILNNDITVLNGASSDPNATSGNWRTTTLIGALGRLNYDYKGRYLFTASLRRDGSSRFGQNYRWNNFPGFSAGWNVSEEPFFKDLSQKISALKLRASWGKVGNDNIGDYSYSSAISNGYDYVYGPEDTEQLALGGTQTAYANPYVHWETSVSSNVGADIYLFDNKFQLTAELYNTEKEDMLFPYQVPASAGVGTGNNSKVPLNIGNMTNKGFELAASYKSKSKGKDKVSWGINGTFSKNTNEVTSMPEGTTISYYSDGKPVADGQNNYTVTAIAKGYEAGAFFMRPTNGLANTEEKLAAFQKLVPTAKMGDLIYVDTDGDGALTDADRVYAGSGMPEWEAGLSVDVAYKGFDFSMQWYASVGNEIINGGKLYASVNSKHQDMVHQWTPDNPYSNIPIFRGRDHLNYASYADIWVEDGSYVRLRNVILGYTIPKKVLNKINVNKLRFYVAAQNPITLTKYDGYDPEVGSNGLSRRGLDIGNYPVAAQYRAGVQLDF